MLKQVCAFVHCSNTFPERTGKLYCSPVCRAKSHNLAVKTGDIPAPAIKTKPVRSLELVAPAPDEDAPVGEVEAATRAELVRLQAEGSALGAVALQLARHIDAPPPGSLGGLAGWTLQHRATLESIRADARERGVLVDQRPESELDRIKARRDRMRA